MWMNVRQNRVSADRLALIAEIAWYLYCDKLTLRAVLFISLWISLSPASVFSTITRCCSCAQVVSIASGLGTRNHQWETSADHLHSAEGLDITTNHGNENLIPSRRTNLLCNCVKFMLQLMIERKKQNLPYDRLKGVFNLITFFYVHNCITQGITLQIPSIAVASVFVCVTIRI